MMQRRIHRLPLLALLLLLPLAAARRLQQSPIQVVVVMGEQGRTATPSMDDSLQDEQQQLLLHNDNVYLSTPEYSGPLSSSVTSQPIEHSLGHALGHAFSDTSVVIVKANVDHSLVTDLRPPSAGGSTGLYYYLMLRSLKQTISQAVQAVRPTDSDDNYQVAGLIWRHGLVDEHSDPEDYAECLRALMTDMRQEFHQPHLPVVIGLTIQLSHEQGQAVVEQLKYAKVVADEQDCGTALLELMTLSDYRIFILVGFSIVLLLGLLLARSPLQHKPTHRRKSSDFCHV